MNFQLNMQKSNLPLKNPKNESVYRNFWNNGNVFDEVNQTKNGHQFRLLDGPPYANGDAHMGHALNRMFKDLVVKSQWFLGNQVHYQPGWDCHGLPLELNVEKKYGKLPYEQLKTRAKQLAFRSFVKQKKTFMDLGCLSKWDQPYFTLSDKMVHSSLKTVKDLFDKNLLEYKQFPVNYCPACASSLAEAELEHKLLEKDSLYFKVELVSDKKERHQVLVWTTTPWTLPMNQAVALNSGFNYECWVNESDNTHLYLQNSEHLFNYLTTHNFTFLKTVSGQFLSEEFKYLKSPLTKEKVPFLPLNELVLEGKTGFVHLSCSHGPEDFLEGQKHGLSPKTYLNKYGVFDGLSNHLSDLNGVKYTNAKALVLSHLKNDELYVEDSVSMVEQSVCWRHKTKVYYNATWQCFLKLEYKDYNLKEKVNHLLNNSEVNNKENLLQMLNSRSQWCLSRQRQWGCKMNLLVDSKTHELSPLTSSYLEFLLNKEDDKAQQLLEDNKNLYVFTDVLDVWFDSGNVANSHVRNFDLDMSQRDYVADLVLEGKDQYRGWFQSLLWLTVAEYGKLPFKNVFCHGFVLDELKQKLSKSAGNSKLVSTYLNQYGGDVLHMFAASQNENVDPVLSEGKMEELNKLYSRFRLSLRFLTSNLGDYDFENHENRFNEFKNSKEFGLHGFMLKEMFKVYKNLKHNFNKYNFKLGLDELYSFFDKYLSGFYFESLKNSLYLDNANSESRRLNQAGMYELLLASFNMLSVYVPFVSEEFYQDFTKDTKSVFLLNYFDENKLEYLESLKEDLFDYLFELRKSFNVLVNELQSKNEVNSKNECEFTLTVNKDNEKDNLKSLMSVLNLRDVFNVSQFTFKEGDSLNMSLVSLKNNDAYTKCPRCWNYELKDNFPKENNEDNLCYNCVKL